VEKSGFIVNKDFNPSIVLLILKRNWYVLPLFLVMLFIGAFLYLRYTQPIFESRSTIQLGDRDQGQEILDIKSFSEKKDLSTTIELLRSQFLFERTIRSMNFYISYYSKGSFLTEERYLQSNFSVIPYALHDSSLCERKIQLVLKDDKFFLEYEKHPKNKIQVEVNSNGITKNKDFEISLNILNEKALRTEMGENIVYFTFNNPDVLANRLRSGLTINALNPAAKTIEISFRSRNNALSRDVVKYHVKQFFLYDKELENQSSQNVINFIDSQLDSITRSLRVSQDSIVYFQYKTNSSSPESASMRLNDQIGQINDEVFRLEIDLQLLQQLESKINTNPNRLDIFKILPDLLGSSYQSTLYSQVADLVSLLERKEALSYSVTAENNEYRNLNLRIQQRITGIIQAISSVKERIGQRILILKKTVNELNSKFLTLPEQSMEFSRLERIKDLNEKYFMMLMDKKSSYAISSAGYTSKNVVLQEAFLPHHPVYPPRNLIYGIAGLIGFLLGFGILAIKYVIYDELNNPSDLRAIIPNVSYLGDIPLVKNTNPYSQLVVHERPKASITEAFRGIRANLNFIDPDAKVYAVSSSISGEGKTFVSLNFAGIKAMTGKRTILIDLDLRKPKIHLGFGADNNKGMSTLLSNQSDLSECIQSGPIENLDFIPAGPNPPNPSELILSKNMTLILESLKALYDVVVIDNPPIGIVTDGMTIFSKADCSIYVFKAGYSKQTFAHRLRQLNESKKIKSLNVVLNGVKTSEGYGYGYKYGDYYDDEIIAPWYSKLLFWKKA
jgi:tyrosine-protein kinase Etk/Wzc